MNHPIAYMFYATILFVIADMLYGFLESRKLNRKLDEIIYQLKIGERLEAIIEALTKIRTR